MVGKINLASITNFWTISSYSKLYNEGVDNLLTSPEFPIDQYKGYLRLDIKGGADPLDKDFLSIFFFVTNLGEKKLDISFQFSFLNSDKIEVLSYHNKGSISQGLGLGCHDFVNKKELINSLKKILLPNDELTIVSKITILEQIVKVQFDECSLQLENLFENKDFVDTTLQVDGKKIEVHKAILASKSPVFYAMFNHDTKEKLNQSIEIVDIDYNVLLELVRFIYTKNVKNIEDISKDLLYAADKYGIDDLKDMCENVIVRTLNLENAADLFVLADLYNCFHLKIQIQMLVDKNMKEFIKTAGFLTTKKSHPSEMLQVLCSSIEKPNKLQNP